MTSEDVRVGLKDFDSGGLNKVACSNSWVTYLINQGTGI